MTYNILNGGGSRLPAITEVIRAHRPDLLALQELRGFGADGNRRLSELGAAVGMRPYLARSRFGQPVAVLVREPAAVRAAAPLRRPFHHAAMRLTVRTDLGLLTVVGTHLYPFSGGRRRWEAGWLARAVDPGSLALVMGDLNALDPWRDPDEHLDRLVRLDTVYRRRHLRRVGLYRGPVDTRAVSRLARAGLVDLYRVAGAGRDHTVPTGYAGNEFGRLRLDYILASPALADRARRCAVVDAPPAGTASDHYPVLADLNVELLS